MSRLSRGLSLALFVAVTACGDDDDEHRPPLGGALEGSWVTEGYGYTLRFDGDEVELYELTTVSCLSLSDGDVEEDGNAPGLGLRFTRDGERLVIENGLTLHITAQHTERPEVCTRAKPPKKDPEVNFEVFWHTFAEQYALFGLYGVDWQSRYDTFRPRVTAATTDDELFTVLSEMLEPLKDGHIRLEAGEHVFLPKPAPAWLATHRESVKAYVRAHYLSGPGVTLTAQERVAYQSLDAHVGYIFLAGMAGFTGDGTDEAADVEAASRAIDEALATLADKDALIIDLRFNGGGYDAASLAIASRFTDREQVAFTKKARVGDGYTPSREFRFAPVGARRFTKPVYLLTSNLTASAAEIFVMAMSALPHVTVVGERTDGAHSDVLSRQLPNGWSFGLSNELYTAPDGHVYEKVGLPPDVEVPLDAPALAEGTDRIFQEARRLASGG
ncbi:S41 family peptidase [Pyxidicoccus parkwayensis]|uniref:S41 family peptidase n=1 Tax=Pyxidicoccus parkwayensis TaxID=2813578 RepID=A0ABX7P0I6_9BACT|nr:S41 family peptidase [Pyxidicoccus parkwaysis]QSQ21818.1 S41 family peptidase [Pyxidicoccus parkwaysis]